MMLAIKIIVLLGAISFSWGLVAMMCPFFPQKVEEVGYVVCIINLVIFTVTAVPYMVFKIVLNIW